MSHTHPAVNAALDRFAALYPEEIDLSLGRILNALEKLGRPQDRLPPVIHVAGTNGKGSTCAFLRAMAEAAGLKVHVSTSPHLVRFNERIRLAGKLIEDDYLVDCLDRLWAANGGAPITHFEASMAAAFLAFSETPADLLILEVGLGGRYDASNVIDRPAVSVITPIDYDHAKFLGTDMAGIAGEKAGIIKAGRPVVSAVQNHIALHVIDEEARALGALLHRLTGGDVAAFEHPVGLAGPHQQANATLAAAALRAWGDERITDAAIAVGAANVTWPARMQRLGPGPLTDGLDAEIWLDGGHNPHAAQALALTLDTLPGPTVMIAAMMAGKDHYGYFSPLAGKLNKVLAVPNFPERNGSSIKDLAIAAQSAGHEAEAFDDLANALASAASMAPDRILIAGSLYLAGEVLWLNREVPE